MKTTLLLLLTLVTLLFISCDEDTTEKKECTATSCEGWEICSDAKVCEKDPTKCKDDTECTVTGETCADFTCKVVCATACTDTEECVVTDDGNVCQAKEVGCTADTDCEKDVESCDTASGKCVPSAACTDAKCGDYGNAHCAMDDDGMTCYCDEGNYYNEDAGKCEVPPACTDDEVGNDMESATEITLPHDASHHLCTLKNDFYKLDLTSGQYIFFKATLAEGDTASFFLLKGKELINDNVVANGTEFTYVAEATQTYYLLVQGGSGVTDLDYTLNIKDTCATDADCNDAFATCNASNKCEAVACVDDGIGSTYETATTAVIPSSNDYTLCAGDVDYFKTTLAVGDNFIVKVEFENALGDIDIKLFKGIPGEDDTPVAKSASTDDKEVFAFIAEEAGDYYLEVKTYSDSDKNKYKLTLSNSCTAHEECGRGKYCTSDSKCAVLPECKDDTVCGNLNSLDGTFHCALPTEYKATCAQDKAHTCGGESTNDKFSTAEVLTVGTAVETEICVDDIDWYKFTLTEDSTDLSVDLVFPKGDLDFVVMGPDQAMLGLAYGVEEQTDLTVGGTETGEMKMLPAGEYYVQVYRYRAIINEDTGEEEPTDVTSTYKLTIAKTGNTTCTDNTTCADLLPLRSVCTDKKACANIEADDYSVAPGGFCENKIDCSNTDDNLYNCMEFGKGTPDYDNFCTVSCSADTDCTAAGINGWCETVDLLWGLFPIKACLKTCTDMPADYCSSLMENGSCVAGKCVAPQE